MTLSIDDILEVLQKYAILPEEEFDRGELPGIGQISENETVYTTSLEKVFAEEDLPSVDAADDRAIDDRVREWRRQLTRIVEGAGSRLGSSQSAAPSLGPPEPHCAWYCPIHFFGRGWGIYLRESCILSAALDIASCVDWRQVQPSPLTRIPQIGRQLLRCGFYVFYLHEQFHHKVESLGLRFLIATGHDRYRPYKANVYRKYFGTSSCLEESLANAESFRRLTEDRYARKINDRPILEGVRRLLFLSFQQQPPGYREAVHYLSGRPYRQGLYELQSQVLDGQLPPSTPPDHWALSPNVITSLMDIAADIYMIVPQGGRPVFDPTTISPGATVSSRELVSALTRHHGYRQVPGGKGSHVKLTKDGAPNIHVPGNDAVVSPGVVKQAMRAIGGYPLSRLPDLLSGRLQTLNFS